MKLLLLAMLPLTMLMAAADPETSAREAVAIFAAGLAQENPEQALTVVSKSLPDYSVFAENLRALLRQNLVTSSVAPQSNQGNESRRELELDWYVEIKSKNADLALVRRREKVRCTVERFGKNKWQITRMEPVSLFAVPVF